MKPQDERPSRDAQTIAAGQVPPAGAISVDHAAHFVPDIEAASGALGRLGFTLTPFSAQSHRLQADGPLVSAGTGNRCVMLERGYLEFLTPTGDTPMADQLRAAISRYVGVHLIAFGTNVPDADHARLASRGFEPLAPVALQRPISTEAGEDTARFSIVRVPPGKMSEGRIQFCQHRTPHLLWQKRWTVHRNAVTGFADVLLCVADAREAAQRYGRFTGLTAENRGGTWRIATSRGTLVIAEPPVFFRALGTTPPAVPWIAGYVLESGDPATTRAHFSAANCDVRDLGDGRFAAKLPEALGGVAIVQAAGSEAFSLAACRT